MNFFIQLRKISIKKISLTFFFLIFSFVTFAQTDSTGNKSYIKKTTASLLSATPLNEIKKTVTDSTKTKDFLSTNATAFYKKRKNGLIQALTFQTNTLDKDSLRLLFPRLFKFNGGQASVIQQVGQREGNYPALNPVTYTRFLFNGGIQIAGLPLRVDALYTTEQAATQQPMNRIGVSLDVEQLKQDMEAKIKERIKQLEQTTRTDDLKNLEKLKKFYTAMDIPSLDKETLKKKVMEMGKDSLAKYTTLAKEKAIQKGNEKSEKYKKNRTYTKVAGKAKKMKNKYNEIHAETAATLEKGNRKINQYLKKENLTKEQIAEWEKMRDSLAKFDAERLKNFDELTSLKAVLNGDLSQGIEMMKKYDLIGKNSWVNYIKHIGIGTQYPSYSRFTLQGQPVTGYAVELQIKNVYLAHAANKNLQAVPTSDTFRRSLSAGRVGLGTSDGTHGFVTVLHGKDDVASFHRLDSLENGIIDTTFYNKPRENHVLSGELQYQWKNKVTLTGEMAQSVTNMNLYDPTGIFQHGQAYSLALTTQLTATTTVGVKSERIGAGFYSLGVPYLRNNLMGQEYKVEQRLLHKHLTLSTSYGKWKAISTKTIPSIETMKKYGVRTTFTFQKLPQVTIDYLVHDIRTATTSSLLTMVNLNANYAFTMGTTHAVSSVTVSNQTNAQTNVGEGVAAAQNTTSNQNVSGTQSMQFSFPLVVTGTVTYSNTNITTLMATSPLQPKGQWVTYGGTVSYTFFGRIQATAGTTYGNNEAEGTRFAHFAESNVQLHKYFTVGVRFENNALQTGKPETDYKETFGKLTLSSRF